MLVAVADHLTQARAGRGQVLLKFLDVIGEWPELGQLVFELPVGFREFGYPLGQLPVADLVDELPHSGSELITFRAEFFDLLAGHGQVNVEAGRTIGKRIAASKTGLREHGLALVDTVLAFHQAQVADYADWQVEVAHPTPAGNLVPDGVMLLNNGSSAFV